MTKRPTILTFALAALSLSLVACGGDESKAEVTSTATTTATSTAVAPELPADLQEIADASTAATDTAAAAVAAAADAKLLTATGEFVSPVRSELSPKVPGRVAQMFVTEGSAVRRGQPVLSLETDYIRLNLQSAQAEVARAKAARDE